jgi:PAS domain S-box-containing protein
MTGEESTSRWRSVENSTSQEAEAILQQLAQALSPVDPELFRLAATLINQREQDLPPEAQLRKAEARYRALVEHIPAVTFLAALDGGTSEIYVSPQIEALLGFSQKEWLENPILWYTQLHPDDRQRWHDEFARTCATGVQFSSEYRFLARDGHVVWVHGQAKVVRDDTGRPLFLQGLAFDISERKRAEEALRRMYDELEILVQQRTAELAKTNEALHAEIGTRQRLEEALRQRAEQLAEESRRKDQFLTMLAHELRNPLAPIRTAAQVMRLLGPVDPAIAKARDVMERQVTHMARLVDDLLDVSRITRGQILLRTEPLDLVALVHAAVEDHRPTFEATGLALAVELPDRPLWLVGDPTRLAQVVGNLLHNAHKFTPAGGQVAVRLAAEPGDGAAVLSVRDSGIGLAPDLLDWLFEPFNQGDQSLDRSRGGLGLGLALVKGLAELHGGTVAAFSPGVGRGSEFTVRLPLSPKSAAPAPTSDRTLPAAGTPLRVLVIEDNPDTAESLQLLLELSGHRVEVAHTGPAGVAAASRLRPDLVLCDIGLPGAMDGFAVARELCAEPHSFRPYLIALSGYGQGEDQRRAQEAGFDRHLTKPVDPRALTRLLETLAPRAS